MITANGITWGNHTVTVLQVLDAQAGVLALSIDGDSTYMLMPGQGTTILSNGSVFYYFTFKK